MPPKVEYAKTDDFHLLRLNGDVRYGDVVTLQRFIEQLKTIALPYIIDLTNTRHLDSTALGCLALVSKNTNETQVERATIYVTDPVVIETLMGVCFDMVFSIQTKVPVLAGTDFSQIDSDETNHEELESTVKKAHKTLAEISESNEQLFQDVNTLLKR